MAKGNPEGTLREVIVDLPPGMVGNPFAVPRCSGADFEGVSPNCPSNTQVGSVIFHAFTIGIGSAPVYNLTPPQGVAASIGFSIAQNNSFQEASLRSADYGVRISDITIPTQVQIQDLEASIWGVPPAAGHDPKRLCFRAKSAKRTSKAAQATRPRSPSSACRLPAGRHLNGRSA